MSATDETGSANGGASVEGQEQSPLEQWLADHTHDHDHDHGAEPTVVYHPEGCACADCAAAGSGGANNDDVLPADEEDPQGGESQGPIVGGGIIIDIGGGIGGGDLNITGPVGTALSSARGPVDASLLPAISNAMQQGSALASTTASFSFLGSGSSGWWSRFSDVHGPYAWSAAEKSNVRAMLGEISSVSALNFVEAADNTHGATLTFEHFYYSGSLVGIAGFPDSTATLGPGFEGAVGLNTRYLDSEMAIGQGGFGFAVAMHEIGHTLGLKHPHDDGGTGKPTFGQAGLGAYDSGQYTVMSYDFPSSAGFAGTLGILDIYTLHQMYGATAANTGDTVYNPATYQRTIWDTGGIDTIDMSSGSGLTATEGTVIDLREGALSYGQYEQTDASLFGIAFGAVIENAIGTTNADTIIGNAADNVLDGGTNNGNYSDRLRGGGGDDTYIVDAGLNGQADVVEENAGEGFDTVRTSAAAYTATANIESVVYTGAGNADLELGAGTLLGGIGHDTLAVTGSTSLQTDVNGGEGRDTAQIRRARSDFTFSVNGATTGLTAADGTQIFLTDIEGRAFQDNSLYDTLVFGNSQTHIDTTGDGYGDTLYADVNNDGYDDRLYQDVNNGFWLSISDHGIIDTAVRILEFSGPGYPGRGYLADADGDLDLDLVFVDSNLDTWLSVNGEDWSHQSLSGAAPIIDSAVSSGTVNEIQKGYAGENSQIHESLGQVIFSDSDINDAHTVSIVSQDANSLGALTAVISDSAETDGSGSVLWKFTVVDSELNHLDAQEKLLQNYDLVISDINGNTVTQNLVIEINGANDPSHVVGAPVLGAGDTDTTITEYDSGNPLANRGVHRSTGSIALTDESLIDNHTVTVTALSGDSWGSFSAFVQDSAYGDGIGEIGWEFEVHDYLLNQLTAGETRTENYLITADDRNGGADTELVTVTLVGAHDSVVTTTGTTGDDTISKVWGDDVIDGGAGNDTITNSHGDDTVYGGDGNDVIEDSHGNDTVFGGAGNDEIVHSFGNDFASGGDGDDYIRANYGDNYFVGGAGNDRLVGGIGSDILIGGDGADRIYGDRTRNSPGSDLIIGGRGNDFLYAGFGAAIFEFSLGDGVDYVEVNSESSGNRSTIQFGEGIALSNLTVIKSNSQDLRIEIAGTTDAIDFRSWYEGRKADLEFSDGLTVTAQGVEAFAASGKIGLSAAAENTAPFLSGDSAASIDEDSSQVSGTLFANDLDADAQHSWRLAGGTNGTRVGLYGTLNLEQTGAWSYLLNNDLAAVQALAGGQTVIDSFTAVVTDEHRAGDTQTIDVTVTGINDGPVIGAATATGSVSEVASGQAGEDTATHTSTGAISFTDVDLTDGHTVTVTPQAGGYRGALTASISDVSTGDGAGEVTWSYSVGDAALDDLDDGDVLTQTYDVAIDDGNGGIVTQSVTVTVNGATDVASNAAPTIDFGTSEEVVYFRGYEAATGGELYKMDMQGNVQRLSDIKPGTGNFHPSAGERLGRSIYFQGISEEFGRELYRLNLDTDEVSLAADIRPGTGISSPGGFFNFDGALYFSADDGTTGRELHRVNADGTVELVANISPGSAYSTPRNFGEFNGALYFSAESDATGHELHRLNADGTVTRLTDINNLPQIAGGDSTPDNLTTFNGSLYFTAGAAHTNRKVYRMTSDGSVETINNIGYFDPKYLTVFGDAIYLQASGTTGSEVYRVTKDNELELVANLADGYSSASSNPHSFTEYGGNLYFLAEGYKVYRIEPSGDVIYQSSLPFPEGSNSMSIAKFGLIFDGALHAVAGHGSTLLRMQADGAFEFADDTVSFQMAVAIVGGDENSIVSVDEATSLSLNTITIGDTDAGTDPLSLSVSVANGTLALASTTGLAVTDVDGSDGTLAFSGTLAALNAALAAGLTYTPEFGFNGAETLSITADDGQGGVTTETLDITVNDNGIDESQQVGTSVADVLNGTVLDDTLIGLGGDDTLNGLDGNDMLIGGAGADALDGGDGVDTASYVDAMSNVLINSEDLTDAPWVNAGGGVALVDAADVPAGIGGIAAHSFTASASGAALYQRVAAGAGAAFTFSAFVSALAASGGGGAVESRWVALVVSDSSGNETRAYFDIVDGVTGSSNAVGAATASGLFSEAVSGGWHRVGFTFNLPTDVVSVRLSAVDSDGATVMSVGDGFAVAGIQVNEGTSATPYVPTAETAVHGVVANLGDASQNTNDAAGDSYTSIENLSGTGLADDLTGDAGDNALSGGGGNDVLAGAAGSDLLTGGAGDDRYEFNRGDGVDTVDNAGESASDDIVLFGRTIAGNQLWFTQSGNNLHVTVIGTTDTVVIQDWFVGTDNQVDFISGDGFALVAGDVQASVDAMALLTPPPIGTTDLPAAQATALAGVHALWQSVADPSGINVNGDNVITGDGSDNVIAGGGGSDTVDGGGGNDTLYGDTAPQPGAENGFGAATNTGSAGSPGGNDWLFGSEGNDTLVGGGGGDHLDGGSGFDTASYMDATGGVTANLADETQNTGYAAGDRFVGIEALSGSDFDDHLTGDSGDNRIGGGAGNDRLGYTGGMDTLSGDGGTDIVDFGGFDSAVWLYLGSTGTEAWTRNGVNLDSGTWLGIAQIDGVEDAVGTDFADQLRGSSTDNVLDGGAGDDLLRGEGGNDRLMYTGGFDTLSGGAGIDTVDFSAFGSAVQTYLGATGTEAWTRNGADLESGAWQAIAEIDTVENILGSNFADELRGDNGNNYIDGHGGNDLLIHSGGMDTYSGGAGTDTIDYSTLNAAVWLYLGSSGTEAWTRGGADLLSGTWEAISQIDGVENAIGTAYADQLRGNDLDNVLNGGAGNNLLLGEGGDDTFVYGGGFDTASGGAGTDTVDYSTFGSAVWVYLGSSGVEAWTREGSDLLSGNWRGIGQLDGVENATGTAFADELRGDGGNNVIDGGDGDDRLRGEGGNDTFIYSGGFDTISGGTGIDTADFSGFGAAVWVNLGSTGIEGWTMNEADLHSGSPLERIAVIDGVENLTGTDFDDELYGDDADNVIDGGAGDDFLWHTGGFDALSGGSGTDVVSFIDFESAVWVYLGSSGVEAWTRNGTDVDSGAWQGIAEIDGVETVYGSAFADTLRGDSGDNILSGRDGDDTYVFKRGDAADTIIESNESGSDDRVQFGATIDHDQLWFRQSNDDLTVSVIGTADSVTVHNWFTPSDRQVDFLSGDGERLTAASVQSLVDAMASFTPPALGETDLDTGASYYNSVSAAISSSWQSS